MTLGMTGTDTAIDDLLSGYFPSETSLLGEAVEDETNLLLAALLMEQRGSSNEEDVEGRYYADVYQAGEEGPEGPNADDPNVDGARIDFGTPAKTVDLRFDGEIAVAFKEPGQPHRTIVYRAQDSPVVGLKAGSSKMWLKNGPTESSPVTTFVEAWK